MRLPLSPGVYIMKNKEGQIIYIGKAKALKNRVSQYFGSETGHSIKVRKMVENVEDFDYILVSSEFEALVLECSLIKRHSPKYNILLKDDKGYCYIRVTRGDWRTISLALQKYDDDAEYIGPYINIGSVRNTVDQANELFRLPTCGKTFPCARNTRPCLNYYIHRCDAPCCGKISREEYQKNAEAALAFVRGDSAAVVEQLKHEMYQASESCDFERAARLRDRIRGIEKTAEKQRVVSDADKNCDVFAVAAGPKTNCLNVLRFREGMLCGSEFFYFSGAGAPDEEDRRELVASYYASHEEDLPTEVYLDAPCADNELLEQMLSEQRGKRVYLSVPARGERLRLVEMSRKNAAEKLCQRQGRVSRDSAPLEELREMLKLPEYPDYIEAYDISHTAGSDNVAGMVVFKNGEPYKSAYRRFSVKGFAGQDDYRSMAETLTRRFEEYEKHKDSGEGFGKLPDLILLDGGAGQVSAVRQVMEKAGLSIPLFGMVKDDKHRTRAVTGDGGEISIQSKRAAFTLISSIQNEVHRFAVAYHHKKHTDSSLRLELLDIDGIGESKARALLKEFKTLKNIKQATEEQLCRAEGISKKLAHTIYRTYHREEMDDENTGSSV